MSLEIKIRLQADDIEYGLDHTPSYCPVARALNRDIGTLGGWWEVSSDYLYWHRTENNSLSWNTPYKVSKWIKNFDKHGGNDRIGWKRKLFGSRFKAIAFSLNLPDISTLPNRTEIENQELHLSLMKRSS